MKWFLLFPNLAINDPSMIIHFRNDPFHSKSQIFSLFYEMIQLNLETFQKMTFSIESGEILHIFP